MMRVFENGEKLKKKKFFLFFFEDLEKAARKAARERGYIPHPTLPADREGEALPLSRGGFRGAGDRSTCPISVICVIWLICGSDTGGHTALHDLALRPAIDRPSVRLTKMSNSLSLKHRHFSP